MGLGGFEAIARFGLGTASPVQSTTFGVVLARHSSNASSTIALAQLCPARTPRVPFREAVSVARTVAVCHTLPRLDAPGSPRGAGIGPKEVHLVIVKVSRGLSPDNHGTEGEHKEQEWKDQH